MKIKAIICVAMLAPVLAFGQVGGNRPRSSYDPAAQLGTKSQQQSGVATALQKINPQDKDYGAAVGQGRIAVLEQTVEDFYWWYCVTVTGILFLLMMYVLWLWKEREMRLKVSADIVSQLYNSYVAARAKALDAIEAHNSLAKRYNVQIEQIAKAKFEAEEKAQKEDKKSENKIVQDIYYESQSTLKPETEEPRLPSAGSAPMPGSDVEDNTASVDLGILVKTLQAQVTAKDQKIANLRTQINRAHSSLEEERAAKNARPS